MKNLPVSIIPLAIGITAFAFLSYRYIKVSKEDAYWKGALHGQVVTDSIGRELRLTCMERAYLLGVIAGNKAINERKPVTTGQLWTRDSVMVIGICK